MNDEGMKTWRRGGDGQDSGMRVVAYGLFFFIEPKDIDNVQVYIFHLSKKRCF